MFNFSDKKLSAKLLDGIEKMELNIKIMHVCGGHQETLVMSGLDGELKKRGIDVRQGPGCPVCVTPAREIESAIYLAENGITISVFGDMIRVPGKEKNLMDLKTEGKNIQTVYSIDDAIDYSVKHPEEQVVFMGIGFETTAPSTASAVSRGLPKNMSVLSTHRYVPPALEAIVNLGELRLSGFIEPGHVCAIIGTKPLDFLSRDYGIPHVVSGFEPMDLLVSINMHAEMIKHGEAELKNEYTRVVKRDGNRKAIELMNDVFQPVDSEWRGFGIIKNSGMKFKEKYSDIDAEIVHEDILKDIKNLNIPDPPGCKCSEVLRGIFDPEDCPLFGKLCKPLHPVGPCMVTAEGGCHIAYKYGRMRR